jgi:hypothetical protein
LGVTTKLEDKEINTETDGPPKQRVSIMLSPYNYTTKILPNGWADRRTWVELVIDDLWVEATRNPAFAQAMGAVLQVAAGINTERALVAKIATADKGIAVLTVNLAKAAAADKAGIQSQIDSANSAKTVLASSLASVRTAMGIS